MKINIETQNAEHFANLPDLSAFEKWIQTAATFLALSGGGKTLSIRFVDKPESALLNETYRHKKGPTNILSFSDEEIPGFESDSFGDLAICIPLVQEEAQTQQKTFQDHLTHLTIHGFLHLLGYDHEIEKEAEVMEALETQILARLNIDDPY